MFYYSPGPGRNADIGVVWDSVILHDSFEALVDAMRECEDVTPSRAVFLTRDGQPVPRFREIGERLNRHGGFAAMSKVAEAMQEFSLLRPEDGARMRGDLRELDMCWNRIGDWMA